MLNVEKRWGGMAGGLGGRRSGGAHLAGALIGDFGRDSGGNLPRNRSRALCWRPPPGWWCLCPVQGVHLLNLHPKVFYFQVNIHNSIVQLSTKSILVFFVNY